MHCGDARVVTALALTLAVRGSWRNLLSGSFEPISAGLTMDIYEFSNEDGFLCVEAALWCRKDWLATESIRDEII